MQHSNELLRKVHKTAQEVVADYLRLLWQYTLDDIRKFHPKFESIFTLRVILTVPAIWSPAAKEKTQQAAHLAGMPDRIKLVTEPEAAALATLKDKAEDHMLEVFLLESNKVIKRNKNAKTDQVGDAFVVCDAGGGTVVCSTHYVTQQGSHLFRI